ncbi:hypothetical protein BT96DRAFT_936508 [Gymnopus androsaceus JB14]|uniref:Uncharacterized protein n=1 Tax=Gymnopus androsaceus JB14 TaxID=1447944 RepID=A0A6A4HXR0_9AGAR|nr:hypothetical protein BT96DRAFT_936508 [Gymnopus androsaceus JB14]
MWRTFTDSVTWKLLWGSTRERLDLSARWTITGMSFRGVPGQRPVGDCRDSGTKDLDITDSSNPFEPVGVADDGLSTTYIRVLDILPETILETFIVSASGFLLLLQNPLGSTPTISMGCDMAGTTAVNCQGVNVFGPISHFGAPTPVVFAVETPLSTSQSGTNARNLLPLPPSQLPVVDLLEDSESSGEQQFQLQAFASKKGLTRPQVSEMRETQNAREELRAAQESLNGLRRESNRDSGRGREETGALQRQIAVDT